MHVIEEENRLPEGIWLIKWIDRFRMGRGFANAARVKIFLQRLDGHNVATLERLRPSAVAYLIGKDPERPREEPQFEQRSVLVGQLPLLRIGDVIEGTRRITRLRQDEHDVQISQSTPMNVAAVLDPHDLVPEGWSLGTYRTLNDFEYQLPRALVGASNCTLFQLGLEELVIPDAVIFKTFYGFHTRLANAICNGPWHDLRGGGSAAEVISLGPFESGIGTGIDPSTGAWKIVLKAGFSEKHAPALAALWFDRHASGGANRIYTDSVRSTTRRPSGASMDWHMRAIIPYALSSAPFRMRVQGFALRGFRPLSAAEAGRRFLVTAIVATSWPYRDQEIRWDLFNSNTKSDDPAPAKVERPYFGVKPKSVAADDDALIDTMTDPSSLAADNIMAGDEYMFLNEPKLIRQVKDTHKIYEGTPPAAAEPPAPVLSAGNSTGGPERPAPLVGDAMERLPASQLRFVLKALRELLSQGAIESFSVRGPGPQSHLARMSAGVRCWSFIREENVRSRTLPAHGWEVLFDDHRHDATGARRRYPRCVLIVEIRIAQRDLLMFEVEPRTAEPSYRSYILRPLPTCSDVNIEEVLLRLRELRGRVPHAKLGHVFEPISDSACVAWRHRYEHGPDGELVGTSASTLLSGLMKAIESA